MFIFLLILGIGNGRIMLIIHITNSNINKQKTSTTRLSCNCQKLRLELDFRSVLPCLNWLLIYNQLDQQINIKMKILNHRYNAVWSNFQTCKKLVSFHEPTSNSFLISPNHLTIYSHRINQRLFL